MSDISAHPWDVIIIGTGIGGGTVGRRLAERGLSVLFVEKGPDLGDSGSEGLPVSDEAPDARLAHGIWPKPISAELDGKHYELDGMIAAGVGGTSLYYAATLERPERHDLEQVGTRPHPTSGWPVGYSEMQPYFETAEEYFSISGEPDPLTKDTPALPGPARPLPKSDAALMEDLRRAGMHPYQTHMAARFLPDCRNCFGRRCARRCKMDGRSAGVLPALATGNAALIDRCSVLTIEADQHQVTGITCQRDGETMTLRARQYIVAAGGLGSPSLLMRSKNEHWPEGLGNRNDLVGRNLMFHLSEIMAVWAGHVPGETGASRSISLRDLYYREGQRFGTVQSMGLVAGYGEILHAMNRRFDLSPLRRLRPLRHAMRIPAMAASKLLGHAKLFVGVLEDLPYLSNRVLPQTDPDQLRISYDISDELRARRSAFRQAMQAAFRPNRTMFMGATPELNFAHPCGTLRFGDDPKTSVLDRDCRVHGLSNLRAADSSFMPTSCGVNPSLTIAANALRVADRLVAEMRPRLAAGGMLGY